MNALLKTALLILASGLSARAAEPSLDALEHQFRELPPAARRQTGPLFWLHGDESRERLEMYVSKVAEGGNGCFTAESRPHRDWLGEGWYRDLGICLEAAKRHDLKMWIFDEKWWPSGEVGGLVPERYGSKRLLTVITNVTGPQHLAAEGFGGPNFIAAVAGQETAEGIDGASLVDLAGAIRDGALAWDVPAGNWKVIGFSWQARKARSGHYLVDGASQDCVDWYIRTVYQPHYDRFKEDFGKNIMGFFYDEPETPGDWGTEVMKVLTERQVDWKRALVAWKFKLAGEEQAAARYQYQDALAEAWGRTFYGGLTRWCQEHGVRSIGHWLEHADLYLHQDYCAGNMFHLQKYSSMGAIDAVFSQFKMGQRIAYDAPCWQIPKLGSSISHAFGKTDDVAMVEIFGARGQDLTYPEMKWWADHMQVSGINFLIPHSFNPRSPRDTDCPPYFYDGGFEPRWPLYRVFADYTSRLSLMLSGGRHVCPVALLFLGGSAHVGKRIVPDQISEALQDALYDCDWLPYEVFERDMQVAGAALQLRQEAYRVLVVPPVEVIPYATLAKVQEYFQAGGVVVGYGFLPTRSATLGKTSAQIAPLREAIWGAPQPGLTVCKTSAAGGRSYLLPAQPTPEQLQRVLADDAHVHPSLEVLEGDTAHWLHVLHRVKAGRDVFFIANQNVRGGPRRFRFKIEATGVPECWDAMRNEITALDFERQGRFAELALTMEPNESALLVFQPDRRPLPARLEPGSALAAATVPILREASEPLPEPKLESQTSATEKLTLSPVKADPFSGRCELPATIDLSRTRVCLEMEDLAPEPAARVIVNGESAGGLISQPLRLDITRHVKAGSNLIRLEPFAPKLACLRLYPISQSAPARPSGGERTRLAFSVARDGGFTFDTGVLRGNLRAGGKSAGLSAVVDDASGRRLDRSMGLCSHYRVFTANHRYGTAAWDWPSEARLQPDGSVEVRWPAAERPFELQAVYRWAAPDTLEVETRVQAKSDLAKFESFLASYFAEDFTNSAVYVSCLPGATGGKGFLAAEREGGVWQVFPRDESVVPIIQDGRWKIEPNPVDWVVRPWLEKPLALRRSPASGLTALLMAPPQDCFAISTPYQAEAHNSTYLSLFGRDLNAGQTARARARLVIRPNLSEPEMVELYESEAAAGTR